MLLLSGPLHCVLTAIFLMLEKLPRERERDGAALGSPHSAGSDGPWEDVVSRRTRLCVFKLPGGRGGFRRRWSAPRAGWGRPVRLGSQARRIWRVCQPSRPARAAEGRASSRAFASIRVTRRVDPPPIAATAKPHETAQVRLVVSRKLCGAVIGTKGQTVKEFKADSGAEIRVQVR